MIRSAGPLSSVCPLDLQQGEPKGKSGDSAAAVEIYCACRLLPLIQSPARMRISDAGRAPRHEKQWDPPCRWKGSPYFRRAAAADVTRISPWLFERTNPASALNSSRCASPKETPEVQREATLQAAIVRQAGTRRSGSMLEASSSTSRNPGPARSAQ